MVINLSQLLIFVYIVVGVFMVMVLWRLFQVLGDVKSATAVINRRTKELDSLVDRIERSMKDGVETVKGFISSIDFIKTIKNKIINKGDQDE